MGRRVAAWKQLELRRDAAERRGGRRDGAGRKRTSRRVMHVARPEHRARHPVQVTVRFRKELGSVRNRRGWQAVTRAMHAAHKAEFRIVHFSLQHDHLHLIVEAQDRRSLARGMQGFLVRAARRINAARRRAGKVWDDRYHARALTGPRVMRNSLVYVLRNAHHHRQYADGHLVDPYSSGVWWDGWAFPCSPPPDTPAPVMPATTWLAHEGWRLRRGGIAASEWPASPHASGPRGGGPPRRQRAAGLAGV